ncbi:amino acid permease [Bacteriovoracaceae bacterium]|nr:amino acid permease [Bacteriovoracaceae bacterium]
MPLKRVLGPALVSLYGIGTILGAGIYALIGKIVGVAGIHAPISFFISAILAILTGYSYTRLTQLYPKSAGEAEYVYQGTGKTSLSLIIGFLVALSGIISCATLLNGFAGYLQIFIPIPIWIGIIASATLGFTLAMIGVKQSVIFVTIGTIIEVLGLILICSMATPNIIENSDKLQEMLFNIKTSHFTPIVSGAFIAFYAYIGFEDIVNLAEETKNPGKSLTLAIFISIAVSTVLYIWVAISAISVFEPSTLIESKAPVADMFAQLGGSPRIISIISLFAIFNGVLAQIIMSSRILYGLRYPLKSLTWLAKVSEKSQVPRNATSFVMTIVLILALFINIQSLAEYTSFTIIIVFSFVNLSLLLIEMRNQKKKILNLIIPGLAMILNLTFLILQF